MVYIPKFCWDKERESNFHYNVFQSGRSQPTSLGSMDFVPLRVKE